MELKKSIENATIVYLNKPFDLKAKFLDNCNTPIEYKLYWEVSKCDENTGLCDRVIPYGKSWSPTSKPKRLFPRIFGGTAYLYIRCVFQSSMDKNKVKAYDYGYVRLVLPPLVATIKGPAEIVKGNHSVVILDASESYDPNQKFKKTQGMSLNWFCGVESKAYEKQGEPATGSPSAVNEHTGTASAESCFNFTAKVNNTSPLLSFNLQNVKGNRTYVFEVVIHKGKRTSRAHYKLRVHDPFFFSIG